MFLCGDLLKGINQRKTFTLGRVAGLFELFWLRCSGCDDRVTTSKREMHDAGCRHKTLASVSPFSPNGKLPHDEIA